MRLNDLPGPHSSLTRSHIPYSWPCSLEPVWIGQELGPGAKMDGYTISDSPKASGSKRTLTPLSHSRFSEGSEGRGGSSSWDPNPHRVSRDGPRGNGW